MTHSNFWLLLVKLVSFAITAMLGSLGILVRTRHPTTDNITKWGQLSLATIGVSMFANIMAEGIDYSSKENSAKATAETTLRLVTEESQTLSDVQRALYSMATLPFDVELTIGVDLNESVPPSPPGRASFRYSVLGQYLAYKKRLDQEIDDASRTPDALSALFTAGGAWTAEGQPLEGRFDAKSSLFPSREREPVVYNTIQPDRVDLAFYKDTVGLTDDAKEREADLVIQAPLKGATQVLYSLQNKRIEHVSGHFEESMQSRTGNGKIVSIRDLVSTTISATWIGNNATYRGVQVWPDAQRYRGECLSLRLKVGFRIIEVAAPRLTTHVNTSYLKCAYVVSREDIGAI